jgi:UDP-N-acetylmuramate-alanine ligase
VSTLLFSAWIAYQAQSLISIEFIGLSIWGWILGGALIGLSFQAGSLQVRNSSKSIELDIYRIVITSLLLLISFLVINPLRKIEKATWYLNIQVDSNNQQQVSIFDFNCNEQSKAYMNATGFHQKGSMIAFHVEDHSFVVHSPGRHTMENAMAALAVAHSLGIQWEVCAGALRNYEGIYRRHQVYGEKNGVILVDDFAHNPVKCARSIEACQPLAKKLIAWFQPHGYGPTKFLRHDFIDELSKAIRPKDEIWMSEIYYAGGTAVKDISADDLIEDLKSKGINAFFVPHREKLLDAIRPHFTSSTTLLLMGARDPSLGDFAKEIWSQL